MSGYMQPPRPKPQSAHVGSNNDNKSQSLRIKPEFREDLRKQLVEKLQKKYGGSHLEEIEKEVNEFLIQNKLITSRGIQELEQKIANITSSHQAHKGHAQQQGGVQMPSLQKSKSQGPGDFDKDSVKSQVSKMSGGSNFDAMDRKSAKASGATEETAPKNPGKFTIVTRKELDDLRFLKDNDEWAAVLKFNNFLEKKEEAFKKEKEKTEKNKFRQELNQQLDDKQKYKNEEKREKAEITNLINNQAKYDKDKIEEEKRMRKEKALEEKEIRDRQLKELNVRKRHEKKQEQVMEKFMIRRLQEEIFQEQEVAKRKREINNRIMQKTIEENFKRTEAKRVIEQKEKEQENKLFEHYRKELDEKQRQREDFEKKRLEAMKALPNSEGSKTSNKELFDKMSKMESREEKYKKRREKEEREIELEKQKAALVQKNSLKEELFKQIGDKHQQKQSQKQEDREQAKMWTDDREGFFKFEKDKEGRRKEYLREYGQQLRDQIKDREIEKKNKFGKGMMTEQEKLINKRLMEKIELLAMEEV